MEGLSIANHRLNAAINNNAQCLEAQMIKLNDDEHSIKERFDLNKKKFDLARADLDVADDDLVEVNAGGKIIAAKRSTLTQLKGTRFKALFSGRWDEKLQRDNNGRIFLDVNSLCFQAIVDYLNEMTISSEESPPNPPNVDDENKYILQHQLQLFGLLDTAPMPDMIDSIIIKDVGHNTLLHNWLEEDGLDGGFNLLYRGSRDGTSSGDFHSKCDNKGCTLTVIETTDGFVIGGFSNTPWASSGKYQLANRAFLFVLCGSDILSPCKMKQKHKNSNMAVYHSPSHGPTFGNGHDSKVKGSQVSFNLGSAYESGPSHYLRTAYTHLAIKEIEVFGVTGPSALAAIATTKNEQGQQQIPRTKPVNLFTDAINEAINAKQNSLLQAELEILLLENSLEDECNFIATFASGHEKEVVSLNVSGTSMATKRSTLRAVEDSVLARQFDDSKWTERGCNAPRVKEWTAENVFSWAKGIDNISDDVANIFTENQIKGNELLAMKKDGLMMLGITRTGTLCLLLDEIEKLRKASQDIITLIEHSPYCFGKILDFLRLSQLHSQGLVGEPALPKVCDSQRNRFEKVVKYYFPGDSAKFILG